MDKALRLWSWDGQTEIRASEIKGRGAARQLWPFIDHQNKMVFWVGWHTRKKTNTRVKPYFKHYAKNIIRRNFLNGVDKEVENLKRTCSESPVHKAAKEKTLRILERLKNSGQELKWIFKNPRVSNFTLSGNFLSGVTAVKDEYPLKTPFLDKEYRFDIALLGENEKNGQLQILGAIEFELSSEFEGIKCLVCKCLGFPLISIDLKGVQESDITEDWCYKKLVETTTRSGDGTRKNFVYIHNMLYPVYMDIPETVRNDNKHQYIVFVKDDNFEKLYSYLRALKADFSLNDEQVRIEPVNRKKIMNKTIEAILLNEGSIAGKEWREYNERRFFRITVEVPKQKSGDIYKFHLAMTALLNSIYDTLVGYKYERGLVNRDDEPMWHGIQKNGSELTRFPIIQKYISEPIWLILRLLSVMDSNQEEDLTVGN